MASIPRFMLAAPSSGTGKTTVTLALLSALKARGIGPVSFKCGPDYIDPMFHRAVLDIPCYNLDLFFTPPDVVRGLMAEHAGNGGVAVVEGVMGYYDGSGADTEASSYEIASITETPVILVVSAYGAALSMAATIRGFKEFRSDSRIAGFVLNNCSKQFFEYIKDALAGETGLPALGYLPALPDCAIKSRHLGLVTAAEIDGLYQKLERLGKTAEECIDIDLLLKLAGAAPPLSGRLPAVKPLFKKKDVIRPRIATAMSPRIATAMSPRIAVAQDEAFCFYYADNLSLLERFGAELVPFSPLKDGALPEDVSGLYLGGGYPELYTKQLSENAAMLGSINNAVAGGLPTFAECGGFLYLHDTLEDDTGTSYPMAGVISGRGYKTPQLQRFGYITLTAQADNLLCTAGESIPGHEFHYWDSDACGADCTAVRTSGLSWPCVAAGSTLFAGFPHLYFYGNPVFAENFVRAAATYAGK